MVSMKGKARAQSIVVYARPCASGSRPAQNPPPPPPQPNATEVPRYLGTFGLLVGGGPSSPLQSVPRTRSQNHIPPCGSTTNTNRTDHDTVPETSVALNRITLAGATFAGFFKPLSCHWHKNNRQRHSQAASCISCFAVSISTIHSRATWRRVQRRNGAPTRKARLFTTWASGAGETFEVQEEISHRAVLTRLFAARKTGVFLKDTGARDEHGMQPLDDIFSSPEKESQNGAEDDEDEESDEEPMDIDESEHPPSRDQRMSRTTFQRH